MPEGPADRQDENQGHAVGVSPVRRHRGQEGAYTYAGVWNITRDCERALDRYEGVSRGLYRKAYFPLSIERHGKRVVEDALVYLMNADGYYPPSPGYLDTIKQGYRDFALPLEALKAAMNPI